MQCGSGLLVVGGGDGGERQGAGAAAQHALHHAVQDEDRGAAGGRHQSPRQVGLNSESIRAVPWEITEIGVFIFHTNKPTVFMTFVASVARPV